MRSRPTFLKPSRFSFTARVRVPATSANLGPGFDALGLALTLYNEVELSVWKSGKTSLDIRIEGEGASRLPSDRSNLVYRMARRVLDLTRKRRGALSLKLVNRIPLARGLGSSSAAIVGGLLAANAVCGEPLSEEDLLRLAVKEEGHPDNVAPAFAGGVCASVTAGKDVHRLSWKDARIAEDIRAVVCVPSFELSTAKARAVLPERVARADAVFNASRVALFLSALHARRYDLFGEAMRDRLHQPYREKLVPGLTKVLTAARKAGAWGAALSGAGPSVLALASAQKAPRVSRAMIRAFHQKGIASTALDLKIDLKGAQVALTRHSAL